MELFTLSPHDPLKACIKSIAVIEVEAKHNQQKVFAPVVDGCPGIIIQDAGSGTLHRDGKILPPVFLFGQSTGYSELNLQGSFNAISVQLQPHALATLFKMNANLLTDSCLDVTDLPGGKSLAQMLSDSQEMQGRLHIIKSYLNSCIAGKPHHDSSMITYVLNKLMSSNGDYSLSRLRAEVNLSERSFERKFKYHVGISPKLFSRICRFYASFKHINSKAFKSLTDAAFENNYADQSHLIKSFKDFAGRSPLQYYKRSRIAAENLAELVS